MYLRQSKRTVPRWHVQLLGRLATEAEAVSQAADFYTSFLHLALILPKRHTLSNTASVPSSRYFSAHLLCNNSSCVEEGSVANEVEGGTFMGLSAGDVARYELIGGDVGCVQGVYVLIMRSVQTCEGL